MNLNHTLFLSTEYLFDSIHKKIITLIFLFFLCSNIEPTSLHFSVIDSIQCRIEKISPVIGQASARLQLM
jgi:hypothetical protein